MSIVHLATGPRSEPLCGRCEPRASLYTTSQREVTCPGCWLLLRRARAVEPPLEPEVLAMRVGT